MPLPISWLILAVSAGALALAPEPAPPVDALVDEALARSPTVAALAARLDAARLMVSPAATLPDPMLGVMYQSVGDPLDVNSTMSMAQLEFSQPLPGRGKLRARRRVAEADAGRRQAELGELRARVATEVRSTYARLYAVDRELEALDAARELVDLLQATASARYSSGRSSQEPLLKAQLEVSRLAERRCDAEAERTALVTALDRLLDRAGGNGLGPVRDLPAVSLAADATLEQVAVRSAPALAVLRAAVLAARSRVAAARQEVRPSYVVGAAAGSTFMPEAAVTLRFGVELPVRKARKQEPALEAARRELAAAEADLRAAEAEVRSQVANLRVQWRRDAEQVVRYREAIVPQTAAALAAARSGYQNGLGDFSTVIEDFGLWLESRVSLARREASRFRTWAELEALVGGAR